MNLDQRLKNREQLKQCFIDLGERAVETDENAIGSICHVIAGTIMEGSDELLAYWMAEYARMRIQMIQDDKNKKI